MLFNLRSGQPPEYPLAQAQGEDTPQQFLEWTSRRQEAPG